MAKKDNNQTIEVKPAAEHILLSSIKPDPNQPRKYFSQVDMDELTESVREKGVLQPILVRPWASDTPEQTYILVCGERRYRAALAVQAAFQTRNTIPAVIRELADEEALELQIIENLQRKDVHPMEEAVAFKSLLDHNQFTAVEIAARVGKSDRYVRQRIKLNELYEGWQRLFYRNVMSMHDALQMAQLALQVQEEWFKEEFEDEEAESKVTEVSVDEWEFKQRKGFLDQATFDLNDSQLDKSVGACSSCQYNTAAAQLFPDDIKAPRCLNVACFKNKSDIFFSNELLKAKEEPGIVFIVSYSDKNGPVQRKLKEEGYTVLEEYSGYSGITEPIAPEWEEFEENWKDENDGDINGCEEAWLKELNEHQEEVTKYEKRIAAGKYIKAFTIGGSNQGKYKYITLNNSSGQKISKTDFESAGDNVSVNQINGEIARLKDREKRAKELDAEKVHKRIVDALAEAPELKVAKTPLQTHDFYLINFLIWDSADYVTKRELRKDLNIDENKDIITQLFNLSGEQKAMMVKRIVYGKFKTNLPTWEGGRAIRVLAEGIESIPIDVFETEQNEKAAKRSSKVDERIAELETQKAELKPKKAK